MDSDALEKYAVSIFRATELAMWGKCYEHSDEITGRRM
jgi:hypothetical protein